MAMRLATLVVAIALTAALSARAETALVEFDINSPSRLAQQHAGRPYIVALWSVYCEPCRHELKLLGEFSRKHPRVAVELVSTDFLDQRSVVLEALAGYALDGIRRWSFASDFADPIRYAIDPAWRGELPRSYLYDGCGGVRAISGLLQPETLQAWLHNLELDGSKSCI
ncbi:MAG: TlpA family protein disulfide reductase [Wenzhouxiangellaceae bacterium]